MSASSVIVVGDLEHPDFVDAVRYLDGLGCQSFASCEAAIEGWDGQWVDAILFLQSRPGRFHSDEIEQLHRLVPLAQLVSLEGGWCEGQFRKGRPLPGIARIYWHQWVTRLSRWLDSSSYPRPVWQRTLTMAEVMDQYAILSPSATPALIAVACDDVCTFDGMAEFLKQLGHSAVWFPPKGHVRLAGVDGLLWCGRVDEAGDRLRLQSVRAHCGDCPTTAVLDFPRSDELAWLAQFDIAVVARPFSHSDLHQALQASLQIGSSGLSASA